MRALRPVANSAIWVSPTSNDWVFKYCSEAVAGHTGASARAICISGDSASGGTALVHQIAKRARRLGRRVLHLDDELFPGNRYLLSKLMHCMGVGAVNNVEGFDGLTILCAGVMELRQYDVVVIDDVQKYNGFSWRVSNCNTQALLHITHLRRPPLIIMTGLTESIRFHHANFVDAGIVSELKALSPMNLDQDYAIFVRDVCEAMSFGNDFFTSVDISHLYKSSQGRVGWTVRVLEWLYLKRAADSRAREHPLYQQLIVNADEDADFNDDSPC